MDDCIFCRIARHEIPCQAVYENERVLAFRDINPQAPVHVLIIPKEHYENVLACRAADKELLGALVDAAAEAARLTGVEEKGFRLLTNVGEDGGQTVHHLHFHLLGGKRLSDNMA